MSYHVDKECNDAFIKLLDALCSFERGSGRRSTLIFIPHNADEEILLAQDGKSIPHTIVPEQILKLALKERWGE